METNSDGAFDFITYRHALCKRWLIVCEVFAIRRDTLSFYMICFDCYLD